MFQISEEFQFFFGGFPGLSLRRTTSKYHICDSFRRLNRRKMKFKKKKKNHPIPLPMPRPSKRKAAARNRDKIPTETASEWEDTENSGSSSGTESPDSMSELGSDGDDNEEWRCEQRRLYSLAYRVPPTNAVCQHKCQTERKCTDIQQLKRKAGEVSADLIEKKPRGPYSKKSRTTIWRQGKHAREHASDIRGYFKSVSKGRIIESDKTDRERLPRYRNHEKWHAHHSPQAMSVTSR